jgi:hypothetical protein
MADYKGRGMDLGRNKVQKAQRAIAATKMSAVDC